MPTPSADPPAAPSVAPAAPAASRPLTDAARVEIVRSLAALAAVLPEWTLLEAQALEPNPFFGPGFFLPLLEERGWLAGLSVLLVRGESGELLGFLPVMRRGSGPRELLPTLRTAYAPDQPHGFLGTPLLRADRARTALEGLLAALDRGLLGGRLLELLGHAADGPLAELLEECLSARRQPFLELAGWSRRLFRPRASGDGYLAEALGAKHRSELRRQRRQLEKQGSLTLRQLAADEPVGPWVEAFLQLEAAGWKGRSGTALALDPAERAFFAAMCERLHDRGMLAFDALELDGRPIALACSLRAPPGPGSPEFVFKITYDETLARQSPGTQLQLGLIAARHGSATAPAWVDSCAAPADSFYRQIWLDERRLGHLLIAPRRPPWPAMLAALGGLWRMRERWRAAALRRRGA